MSSPWFFYACLGAVLAWALSAPLWTDLKSWQVVLHTGVSILTLLLIALLENASRRGDESEQEKLNVIAEALAALMESRSEQDPDLRAATERLRAAVGLEERH
ncbi:MAG: low affinity iron permease family protein [Sporichthyaceae bacterium]